MIVKKVKIIYMNIMIFAMKNVQMKHLHIKIYIFVSIYQNMKLKEIRL